MAKGLHGRKPYEYWPQYLQRQVELESREHYKSYLVPSTYKIEKGRLVPIAYKLDKNIMQRFRAADKSSDEEKYLREVYG